MAFDLGSGSLRLTPSKGGRLASLNLVLCAAMAVATVIFLALGPSKQAPDDLFGGVGGAGFVLLSLAFAAVGAGGG
jgi:hypothetical protein